MLGWIKEKLFGPVVDYKQLLADGAILVDVRSTGEFSSGNAKGSINVPLDSLGHKLNKLKTLKKPIVTCCASGMRSGVAASKLKAEGLEAYNGGGWSKYA
jgi:phage shock protein E